MGLYGSLISKVGDQPWMRPVSRRLVPKVDRFLLRSSGLQATPNPTLLLTTVGRISGEVRQNPLYYLKEGDSFVVIASNYGQAEPSWSQNLKVNPTCTAKIKRTAVPLRARHADLDKRDGYVDRFAEFYAPYRSYVARAGREIPIWLLESAGSTG